MTTYTIRGRMLGQLWWEGEAWKHVEHTFTRTRASICLPDEAATLREAVDALDMREGADFRPGARLTADTELVVRRQKGRRTVTRYFPITLFRSVADYVTDEVPEYNEEDCE